VTWSASRRRNLARHIRHFCEAHHPGRAIRTCTLGISQDYLINLVHFVTFAGILPTSSALQRLHKLNFGETGLVGFGR